MKTIKINRDNIAVIYHDHCSDGLTSAGIAAYFLPKTAQLIGGSYNETPPNLKDTHIFFVDFCYKKDIMQKFLDDGNFITLIDHHKSQIEENLDLFSDENFEEFVSYDNSKSGTGLTWAYFSDDPLPYPFAMIQDRDLWTWSLYDTKNFLSGFDTLGRTLDIYLQFTSGVIDGGFAISPYIEKGSVVVETKESIYRDCLTDSLRFVKILDHENIPCVNCPGLFHSDIGSMLNNMYPESDFALLWYITDKGMKIGLRSKSDKSKTDVSKIAQAIHPSGGGHYSAAGVNVSFELLSSTQILKDILG